MGIAGFQQDPSAPPGAGWFYDEFGNKRYAYDPVNAQNVVQQGDQRLAQMAPDTRFGTTTVEHPEGGARGGGPVNMSDATPNYSSSPQQQMAQQAVAMPGQAPQNENQAITGTLQNNISRALLGQQTSGPTRSGFVPSSRSTTVSDIKRPITEEEYGQYQSADAEKAMATVNTAKMEREKQLGIASSAMAALPAEYAQRELAQKKRNDIAQLVQQDRGQLDQFTQELQQNQKSFNPNRLFDEKLGTSGTIAAALFRAIGTYAQIKGHLGSNPAGEVIDAAIQRDIMQQREAIESSKGNVDNALNRLRLHFGDLDQAEKALQVIQHNYADMQTQFYAAATGSQQVIENARGALAEQQQASAKRLTEFLDRSTGVATRKIEEKYQQGGTGQPNLKQALENYKTYAEASKTLTEANAAPKTGQRIATTIAAGNNAISTLEDSLGAMGYKPDQHGEYEKPGFLSRKGTVARNKAEEFVGTERGNTLETNKGILSGEIGKLATGGAADKETIATMNHLLDKGDPASLMQLHKLMRHFVRNYQNVGQHAGEDITDTSDMGAVYGQ